MSETNGMKEVWTVIEENADGKKKDKAFWLRIGTAFTNKDDSLTILFDALPVNRKVIVREPRPRADVAEG